MVLGRLRKRGTQHLFYSGKGGVGKTTVAAATALWHSRRGKKVLIISTDPAHSLSDSFDMEVGSDVRKIGKNLYAVEIDPKKAMEEYKEKIMPHLEKVDYLKGLGLEDTLDIAGMTPGVDEMAAMDRFLQYMSSREYDIIVFDTAPTGHALRFLSLPDVLDSWVGKIIKIRMKLSGLTNMMKKILPFGNPEESKGLGTEQLDEMKKRIEEAKAILSDPGKTSYNIVMIPELMSILESERSLSVLDEYNIPVKGIIINQLIPSNPGCRFCTEKRKTQQERVRTINQKFRKFTVMELPMFRNEVRGLGMLEKVGKQLYG